MWIKNHLHRFSKVKPDTWALFIIHLKHTTIVKVGGLQQIRNWTYGWRTLQTEDNRVTQCQALPSSSHQRYPPFQDLHGGCVLEVEALARAPLLARLLEKQVATLLLAAPPTKGICGWQWRWRVTWEEHSCLRHLPKLPSKQRRCSCRHGGGAWRRGYEGASEVSPIMRLQILCAPVPQRPYDFHARAMTVWRMCKEGWRCGGGGGGERRERREGSRVRDI